MIPPEIEQCALLGWHIYPASRKTKAGCFRGASAAATDDLNQLARWAMEYPSSNWRVVFGPSRLWGLDIDAAGQTHANDGISAFTDLVKVHGGLIRRPALRSGGGGYAIFFSHQGEKIVGDSGHPALGIDPRRGQQSQTIPPSIHTVTGRAYRWLVPPWQVAPPVAPAWLLRLVAPPLEPSYRRVEVASTDQARRRLYLAAFAVMDAAPGSRNETLNRRAYQMGRMIGGDLLGEDEAVQALYSAARSAGLDHGEIVATIRSGILSGRRNPTEIDRGGKQ